jgi:hypothetical protein
MNPSSRQSAKDSRAHIPAHIEQAMKQHMQQNVPAHLKKYVGGSTYVPQHAQTQLAQAMQKNIPAHLKQYTGAYMQQKVIQPNTARLHNPSSHTPVAPGPTPDKLRLEHSMPGQQHTVEAETISPEHLFKPVQTNEPAVSQPEVPASSQPHQPYEFFMNPAPPAKKPPLGGSSILTRIALLGGGLVILMIAFVIVKNLLGGGAIPASFTTVAQDQQSLIHLLDNASQQDNLSNDNQNFVATAGLSLNSSQSDVTQYMSKNGKKIDPKQLNLKINDRLDSQLSEAAQASTYNQTFDEIMQAQLNMYLNDLKLAYRQSQGPTGRTLMNDNYKEAQLLLDQLVAVAD